MVPAEYKCIPFSQTDNRNRSLSNNIMFEKLKIMDKV